MILACYDVYYQNWGLEGNLAFSYIDAEKFVFYKFTRIQKTECLCWKMHSFYQRMFGFWNIFQTQMFLALSPGSKSDQQESIMMKCQFDSWWNSSSWRLQIRNFWMVWVSRLIFPPLIWLLDKRGEGGYRQLMLRRSEVAVKGQEVNDGWGVALST